MDWKVFFTTFAAIFLAELGDKTQLATLGFSVGGAPRYVVFLAAALALVASTAIAVIAGETLVRFVSPLVLQRAAAVSFVVIGGVMLVQSFR
jgi:putative Ca2+/H+ antiporter (TMEM165/GDT1 family)